MSELHLFHTLPTVCLLVDYLLNAVPFTKRHVLIVVPVTTINMWINIYIHSFESVKQKTNGKRLSMLDDSTPETFIMMQIVLVLLIIWFFMLYALNQLKLNCFAKSRCQESELMLVFKM